MAVYDRPSTRFNRLLLGDNTRPQSRAAEAIRPREVGLRFPRQPVAPTPSYGLSPMMQGIAQRSAVPYMSPLAKAMRQTTTPTPTPTPDGTFMQKMSSPQGRALAAAGMAGLQLGGYQDRPVSLGQGIAQMGAAAMGAYDKAQAAKAAADAAAFTRRMELAQYYQKEREIGGAKGKEQKTEQVQEARLRRDLRKDFQADSEYFGEAQRFWKDVVNYSKPEQSSASDLALVFSYMKMLDPDSVVREGEQMQVRGLGGIGAEARALLSRIGVNTEGAYDGGMLIIDPTIRANIREAAGLRFADLAKSQASLEEYTAAEGARAGLSSDFFKSKIEGDGNIKRPYVVNSLDDLPEAAKSGDYAVVNGVLMQIREQS